MKYLHNSNKGLWGKNKEVIIIPEFSIGKLEGKKTEVFGFITDIEIDSIGNIYIADERNYEIRKFDNMGNYLLSIGKKGEGPGEIIHLTNIEIDSKNNVYVLDRSLKRISIFDCNGEFVNSFNFNLWANNLLINSKDELQVVGEKNGNIFHVFNEKGILLYSFGKPIKSPIKEIENFQALRSPTVVFMDELNNLYHTNPFKYEIIKYNSKLKLAEIIDRDIVFPEPEIMKRISKSGAIQIIPMLRAGYTSIIKLDNDILAIFLFMESKNSERPIEFVDFYNSEGKFLGSFNIPDSFFIAKFANDKFYAVISEPFPQVIRYTIKLINR